MAKWVFGVTILVFISVLAGAQPPADPDQEYIAKFLKAFPKEETPPTLETYATPQHYDELYLGENLDKALKKVSNDSGGIAWGLSYRMISLNEMFRATGDRKYLDANLRCIRAVLAATDDKIGKKLWNGRVVKAWGCDKYAERGRAIFAVHTGIITAPILDFLLLVKDIPEFKEQLGPEYQQILDGAKAALTEHDRQWRGGPNAGEGHYIGLDQENSLENKPLPGNRLSAMGWALWISWKVSGDTTHRDLALGIGHYMKNRLTIGTDGAYYWPYALPTEPVTEPKAREDVKGEDSSHGGLTMEVMFTLAKDNKVFTPDDMKRFAKTAMNGYMRRADGILMTSINGMGAYEPSSHIGIASRWLPLATYEPQIRDRILTYYLNYRPTPGPLDLALLLRFQKKGITN
ncbi:MAG TPA: hypothetical protein PLI09_25275 [Candidatus Hydrogenedentes bacterium]|nr:hypothetical protein [Candidatus Hydrogenedentota bacterium]